MARPLKRSTAETLPARPGTARMRRTGDRPPPVRRPPAPRAANTAPRPPRGQGGPMSSTAIERNLFRVGVAVVAAHVLDDTLVHPPSGTPATDHLVSAAVPVA